MGSFDAMKRSLRLSSLFLLCALAPGPPASAQETLFQRTSIVGESEEAVRARDAKALALLQRAGRVLDPQAGQPWPDLRCSAAARRAGEPVRGVPMFLGATLNDPGAAAETQGFGRRRRKTKGNGWAEWTLPIDPEANELARDLILVADLDLRGNKRVDEVELQCTVGIAGDCVPGAAIACLDDRFRVRVDWIDPFNGEDRQADVSSVGADGALFSFTGTGTDLLVDVLDDCPSSSRFWVFYGAATNVEFTLSVTDTETGATRSYFKSPGSAPPPITDTSAFATCP